MHLLHNTDGSNSIGYGYDIYEIARYFNYTNGDMDDLEEQAALDGMTVDEEIMSEDPVQLAQWMSGEFVEHYRGFVTRYKSQLCEDTRYIDDFIELVNQINAANPGRPQVRVLLCLNILSETAQECVSIANYLRNHGVLVTGVELGNECYDNFQCDVMGFMFFKHHDYGTDNPDHFHGNYWDYINGNDYDYDATYTDAEDGLALVLSDAMKAIGAHNYISKFRNASYNYKIGIPGKPLGGDYAFKTDDLSGGGNGCDPYDAWNTDLRSMYSETLSSGKYKFDAVILHTYFAAVDWDYISIENLGPEIVTVCNETNSSTDDDRWDFSAYDDQLEATFDGIIGIGGLKGNFTHFLTKSSGDYLSYKISLDRFNYFLNFDLPASDPSKKELWITEWNLKDHNPNYTDADIEDDLNKIFSNGFTHGFLLMQWWLRHVKINYDATYRNNFFTYATLQNYAGGVPSDLLTASDEQERDLYGIDGCPYEPPCTTDCETDEEFNERNYYVRRTSYYVAKMLSTISSGVKYLPAHYVLPPFGLNMQPTTFIDLQNKIVYVYYTNLYPGIQSNIFDPENLLSLFPGAISVEPMQYSRHYLHADQVYSTSGNSRLYRSTINDCYDNTHPHPIEMQGITYDGPFEESCTSDPHNLCLDAPGQSIGYFEIPLIVSYGRENEVQETSTLVEDIILYPNPSSADLYIQPLGDLHDDEAIRMQLRILDMQGNTILEEIILPQQEIHTQNLPSGCYSVEVSCSGAIFHKQFMKI